MRIRELKVRAVAAPMKRPLATSIATVTVAPLLLLDLQTDSGIVGRSYLFALAKHHLPPLAIANTKTILEEYAKSSGAPDARRMRAAMERCARSEDYKEGRRAFMEKRKPRFQGK